LSVVHWNLLRLGKNYDFIFEEFWRFIKLAGSKLCFQLHFYKTESSNQSSLYNIFAQAVIDVNQTGHESHR
jgi:hypothetical protein